MSHNHFNKLCAKHHAEWHEAPYLQDAIGVERQAEKCQDCQQLRETYWIFCEEAR